jgi:hypothetical protein
VIATGLAALTGRRVRLRVVAVMGAESHVEAQVDRLVEDGTLKLDLAVVMVGANDVTHRVKPAIAVRHLGASSAGTSAPSSAGSGTPVRRSSSGPAPTSARSSPSRSPCAAWHG